MIVCNDSIESQPFCFSSYIQYSSLCARLLRRALKPEVQQQALKSEESAMKAVRWDKGKPTGESSEPLNLTPVFVT